MRIDLNPGNGVQETQAGEAGATRPSASKSAQANEVQFAESNSSVGKLAAAALNAPEVRHAKVEALRTQIAAGTYQVSSRHVADSVIEQMRMRAS
jgi:negative regulator of flagellin synthesis FlgM